MTFTIPTIYTAVDKFSQTVKNMGKNAEAFAAKNERALRTVNEASKTVAKNSLIVGAAILAPLALAGNEAIKFEDKMADIAKTTGLSGKALQDYGDDILNMSTKSRTSIDDFLKIGEIGGQLGIAQQDLVGFTDSVNKFNVAIGKDFQGGIEQAATQIGNIKTLFVQTRDINIAEAITKTGSAINELGAKGSSTSANITDFTLRLGALPDALKPSITDTLALGAAFEESGITSEIAARGFGDLVTTAGKNVGVFAKQMGIAETDATKLLNSDPVGFAKKFASSLNGLDSVQLSKTLEGLKIGDTGTMKVVGALSTGAQRLGELQQISNESFKEGTSLLTEYEKKNSTTAAQLEIAKNNFQALAITIGTQLLPIIGQLIGKVTPFIKGVIDWTRRNPKLTQTILYLSLGIAALALIVSGVSSAIAIGTSVILAFQNVTKIATAAQWLWNVAMSANPIVLVIIAVTALIALIIAAIAKYQEWGAALLMVLGPLGWIVNLVQSFRRNWDMVKKAFSEDGILAGLQAIGAVIYDALLMPMQQLLEIIQQVTGAEWAGNAAKNIEAFRKDMGVNVSTDEAGQPLQQKPVLNPEVSRQESFKETMMNQKISGGIKIEDGTGRAKITENNNVIPLMLSSTMNR